MEPKARRFSPTLLIFGTCVFALARLAVYGIAGRIDATEVKVTLVGAIFFGLVMAYTGPLRERIDGAISRFFARR